MFEARVGLFGRTHVEHQEDGRRGGAIGGRLSYERGTGVHAQTPEERRISGVRSAIARGKTVWLDDERKMAYELSQDPYFKDNLKVSKYTKIAQALNGLYHNCEEIRTAEAARAQILKYKKTLENRAKSA